MHTDTSDRTRPVIRSVQLLAAVGIAVCAHGQTPQKSLPMGTYGIDWKRGAECRLAVAPVASDTVRIQLDCNRGAPSYNMGDLDEHVPIRDSVATFVGHDFGSECTLVFRFTARSVVVSQHEEKPGSCGFGYGVEADGVYRRMSKRRPKFDLIPPD